MSDRAEIGELWRTVNRELHDRFKQAFRDIDMAPTALFLLRNLEKEPGLTVSELARRMSTVKSHISKTIDQLVVQGLVEKRTDPADQRLIRTYLTDKAFHMKAEVELKAAAAWAEVMEKVPDHDLATIEQGLQILLTALEKARLHDHKE